MAITIYLKDGAVIDDALIDNIQLEPESNVLRFTDRFGKHQERNFNTISCIIIKGVASYDYD